MRRAICSTLRGRCNYAQSSSVRFPLRSSSATTPDANECQGATAKDSRMVERILSDEATMKRLAAQLQKFMTNETASEQQTPTPTTTAASNAIHGGLPLRILRSIVKIYVSNSFPNCIIPWQMRQQISVTGTGFVVDLRQRLILTNAHVVQGAQYVELRKHGDSNNHTGYVLFMSVDCDLAVVHVPEASFWEAGLEALEFEIPSNHVVATDATDTCSGSSASTVEQSVTTTGLAQLASVSLETKPFCGLPQLQESVKVAGYPVGGEQISITSGVVSRIDISSYGRDAFSNLLTVQIDAAINHGNSGGPALHSKSSRVIGIAFQVLGNAESIGYIIPVPIVAAFVAGFYRARVGRLIAANAPSWARGASGTAEAGAPLESSSETSGGASILSTREYFERLPSLSIVYQVLLNKHLRSYCGLKQGQTGVLVTTIFYQSPCEGLLFEKDVLLAINGFTIENDGTIEFRERERVHFQHIANVCPPGQSVRLTVLRNKCDVVEVTVAPSSIRSLVRQHLFTAEFVEKPKYCIVGGLVFSTLTNALLAEWGAEWYNTAPRWLVHLYSTGRVTEQQDEVVVVVQVIPHPVNQSYECMYARGVTHINGVPVRNFAHLKALIQAQRNYVLSRPPPPPRSPSASAVTQSSDDDGRELFVVSGASNGNLTTEVVLPMREAMAADVSIAATYQLPVQVWDDDIATTTA